MAQTAAYVEAKWGNCPGPPTTYSITTACLFIRSRGRGAGVTVDVKLLLFYSIFTWDLECGFICDCDVSLCTHPQNLHLDFDILSEIL
jgi:hypothetical protein